MASTQVLNDVKTAMMEYYTLLCRMPHFPPDSLLLPPPGGWPKVDVETLRTLGRSDAAIEFARHLPCLKPCIGSESAWITPLSRAIPFHEGETWPHYIDTGIAPPTPPHLFYISYSIDARLGVYLAIDTEQGTIVELAGQFKEGLTWQDEEEMPADKKWTAYRALPAKEFFRQQTVSMLNLHDIPVPPAPSITFLWEPRYHHRIRCLAEQEALEGIEDPWEADHEVDSDYAPSGDESISDARLEQLQLDSDSEDYIVVDEDVDEDEDMTIDSDEVEGLRTDTEEYERTHVAPPRENYEIWRESSPLSDETLRVYDIYKRNGWPYEYFDLEQCRAELLAFAQELDDEHRRKQAEADRTRPKNAKEWAEDRRQRMKKIWLEQGKPWDEEKEKTQTAEEWLAEFNATSRKQYGG